MTMRAVRCPVCGGDGSKNTRTGHTRRCRCCRGRGVTPAPSRT